MPETTAVDTEPPASAHKQRIAKESSQGSAKETVESILIAFILAFIFRGFVVEAFVIPTGSMAPTLYGAHMRLECPDCGYTWDVGFHGGGDDTEIPTSAPRAINYHCPNCGYAIAGSRGNTVSATGPEIQPVRFGDRILVLKYLYLMHGPRRWDVVVFKAPVLRAASGQPAPDPSDPDYAENYIKRLAGLPGESVVILDGSVYAAKGSKDLELLADDSVKNASLFQIQRRPAYAQDRLWRTVYDNDYVPHLDRSGDPSQFSWRQPWTGQELSGWRTLDGVGRPSRIFSFDSLTGSGELSFNPDANADMHSLTDWLGYDEQEHSQAWSPTQVSDLKLTCFYTRKAGNGPMMLQLTKRDDVFTARILPGKVALLHGKRGSNGKADLMIGGKEILLSDVGYNRPARLELSNVDYRVTLKINGRIVLQTTDAEYSPDVATLFREAGRETDYRAEAKLIGDHQTAVLDHLSLSRNIYYLNKTAAFWANPRKIVHLGSGEYFVLGDNSFISGDARYWDTPVELPSEGIPFVEGGRVPAEFMLGKAFFVYWPAGYQPTRYLPVNIVPDFGEMRFIH